ncbi:rhamnose-binding lectin-like [Brachionus plicatilis]|uniref:Rhamnose-binding lectin-like n=1 Tax=Brachionus plicatilis TaxID=10195 RepID=A0A3M7SZL2_BRAPC|nr:rhamnose-binding lectin-like [Brachionus plicatilis]
MPCKIEKKTQIELNLAKCLNTSVYEPVPIDSQFIYSLGSPILQTVVCYGSKLHLKCPSLNHKLHIHSAYFGIQKNTKNYCWSNPNGLVCYRNLTYHYIRNLCQNKFSCDLIVTDTYFGNPCPIQNLYHNQLLIQYQCFDDQSINLIKKCDTNTSTSDICPPLNNSNHYQQQWCEPSKAIIKCPKGTLIKIICAYYGIDNKHKCTHSEYKGCPTKCYAENTISTIQNMCNQRSICFLEGENSFELGSGLTNACQGFQNILLIQWECVSNEQTTLQPHTTLTTLPTCSTRPFINASCDSTHSPYVPQPLTNSTLTHFSYPIYQQIVCQGSTLVLVCPSDLVIHIYSAYFGIQEPTRSTFCTNSEVKEMPAMMYSIESFNTVFLNCQSKNFCQLKASVNSLGGADLNREIGKQLVVQYQCVDPYVLENQISKCGLDLEVDEICPKIESYGQVAHEDVWCDEDQLNITCELGKKIEILCAFYGIHPSISKCDIANLPFRPVCYFNSSFSKLKDLCDSKEVCSVDVINSALLNHDPCNGLKKAIFVQWKCY